MLGQEHVFQHQWMRDPIRPVKAGRFHFAIKGWLAGMCLLAVVGCAESDNSSDDDFTSPLDQTLGFDPIFGVMHRDRLYESMADCLELAGFDVPGLRTFYSKFELNLEGPAHLDAVYRVVNGGQSRYERVSSPLDEYATSLGPTAASAFYQALDGTPDDPGCAPKAQTEVYGTTDSQMIQSIMDDIMARVDADQRMISVDAAWADCMRDFGYDFGTPADAVDHLADLANEFLGKKNSGVDLSKDEAAKNAVQYEIHLEQNYNRCAEDVGRPHTLRTVILEVQQAFVDEHPELRSEVSGG